MARGKFAQWFLGEDRPAIEPADTENDATSPFIGERDQTEQPTPEPRPTPPGWYLTEGTLRYFDGTAWTEHVAPPQTAMLTTNQIAGAVFLGVFAALFLVWLGAQIDPDTIYFPVKFVVEEAPEF
jgi:hypothetical protein